jgi:hypothetical protein
MPFDCQHVVTVIVTLGSFFLLHKWVCPTVFLSSNHRHTHEDNMNHNYPPIPSDLVFIGGGLTL